MANRALFVMAFAASLRADTLLQGWYRGEPVQFRDYNGQALVEGDMLLGPVEELLVPPSMAKGERLSVAVSGDRFRWTDRIIPYEVDPAIPSPDRIQRAVEAWNTQTVVRLVPRGSEANYVRFVRVASGCSANVGMLGGRQVVNLGDGCTVGNTIHEIGHAVGLHHTQTRNDRNRRLRVLKENIDPGSIANWNQGVLTREDIGPYDFGSVMHYSDTGFAVSGRSVAVSIPPGIPFGQRSGISAAEVIAVARLFGDPVRRVLVDTVPSGLPVIVDGESVTTPKLFDWPEGELHTLAAAELHAGTNDNEQYRFAHWSDGGTAEHAVRIGSGGGIYMANYARHLRLRVSAIPADGGTVEVSPPSPDGFYPSGTMLRILATPGEGWRFFSWNPGAGATTYLGANLQGNGANPVEYSIRNSNAFYVAAFTRAEFTVITSRPPGVAIVVDGAGVYTPRHVQWLPGSNHTLSVAALQSPLSQTFTRYEFRSWSNGGERTQTVRAEEPTTITAELATQHRVQLSNSILRTSAALPAPAAPSIVPAGEAGWHDEGSRLQVRVAGTNEIPFSNWSGDLGGTAAAREMVVAGPVIAIALFQSPRLLSALAVTNDASRQPVALAPGALFTVHATGFDVETATIAVEGRAARVVRRQAGQVTFECPSDIPLEQGVGVTLRAAGITLTARVPTQPASPGIYTLDGSGEGLASEGEFARGSVVAVRVTGLGEAGTEAAVFVDGERAEVVAVEPGGAGLHVVSFRVPERSRVGARVPVTVEAGGARSQSGVFVAVQ
jgi:uncharacterized protein (TIGR03437 family)